MRDFLASDRVPLPDQADGLRRLFAGAGTQFIAVAANPAVAFAGLALERLAAAALSHGADPGRRVLVVDAAAGTPQEMAALDLASCVEPIAERLDYLAARGLPLRHVDARGSCEAFLDALQQAAPRCAVVIVHAPAGELGRLFARRNARPLLLAADHPASVTSAYANMKLLAQRHGLMAFDLLLVAAADSPRSSRIAEQLAATADRFAGAVLRDWAAIDPAARGDLPPALRRLAQGLLADDPALHAATATAAARDSARAGAP